MQADAPKGHPKGLYILFGTEMWERFSYYGMRALLVLYLVEHHGFQPQQSSSVYKWYTSLVYLTPLLGGFLADRFLGLRMAIIIGAILMAIGHFLMAFEPLPIFYTALAFLIAGNGFFKPNISTLVGKMYKQGDPRRDGAFTIFYMGINLGAFLSPLVCGEWLRKHYGFHYGFGAAGVGMVFGLLMFVFGQKWVIEAVHAAGNSLAVAAKAVKGEIDHHAKAGSEDAKDEAAAEKEAAHEREDEAAPAAEGAAGLVAKALPILMLLLAVIVPIRYGLAYVSHEATISALFMPVAFSCIAAWMAVTLLSIKGAARDKSIVIFALFIFVVLFWMAFEQAGNALNLWAEFFTDRQIGPVNVSAEAFQSVNAIMIVVFAPIFATLWVRLARAGKEPSTPLKMAIAMVLMTLSFAAMVAGAAFETQAESRVPLAAVPAGLDLSKLNAGRTTYDAATHELVVRGVLPEYGINEALQASAGPGYLDSVNKLVEASQAAKPGAPISSPLAAAPATFAPPWKGDDAKKLEASWDGEQKMLRVASPIDAQEKVALLNAGAPPEIREAIGAVAEKSQKGRVSSFWLFLSYLLATLGELCLSPVGLSMVTKLAPARFASLFMGVWLLSSSVAQYAGGSIGESWGRITPTAYFNLFVVTSVIGAVVLFVLVAPLKRLMHNVS